MRAILTYHSIDESGSVISISEEVFREQVVWLARSSVRVVSLDTLMRMPSDANAVALTFDDGFVSFGDVAAPLLADHGMPSTLFVVADAAGKTNRWPGRRDRGVPELPLLGWDALGRLRGQGVEIGGHTRTHVNLARLTKARIEDEVIGGAERIRTELGQTPVVFAYPYGAVNDAAVGIVASRFAWGCTTDMRWVSANEARALLPRIDMFYLRTRGQLERWGTARFRYHLSWRAGARLVRRRFHEVTEGRQT
ncbi:MAG TPA: polysaccharide deacetylase family protein [Gemmatimonadaceae bacterium]|nr:polysaccharide deacetylase family protein [Gemmatimonadaceae bacterium]